MPLEEDLDKSNMWSTCDLLVAGLELHEGAEVREEAAFVTNAVSMLEGLGVSACDPVFTAREASKQASVLRLLLLQCCRCCRRSPACL